MQHLSSPPPTRRLHVVFGDPRYLDCKYTGVCRIELDIWDRKCDCASAVTFIRRRAGEKLLDCFIPRAELTPAVDRHFHGSRLIVPAPCPLSVAVARQLGFDSGFKHQVVVGNYPLIRTVRGVNFCLVLELSPQTVALEVVARTQVQ